jgi:predicted AlkP superfamily pyrophosphatase or phosphodiesterase
MAEPEVKGRSRVKHLAGGVLALAGLTACGNSLTQPTAFPTPGIPVPTPTPTPTPPPPPRVALISIDGLRPDALSEANSPGILALAARGAYTFGAQTVYPSTTLPSHASMLTGQDPIGHGINFDEYRDTFQLKSPTVPALVHAAGKRSLMVVGKDKFRQLNVGSNDGYVCATRGDDDVANEAIVQLQNGFDFLFVHFPGVDNVGHASGWMSPEYVEQLKQTDAAVSRLIGALPMGTTIILTADHGGQLKSHGTQQRLDMTIPWIIVGPRVARRGLLTRPIRTVDTAVTVLGLLSLSAPRDAIGHPLTEPFEPGS